MIIQIVYNTTPRQPFAVVVNTICQYYIFTIKQNIHQKINSDVYRYYIIYYILAL